MLSLINLVILFLVAWLLCSCDCGLLSVHQPWDPECTASQTRQTDGRHDDANSRS